MACDAIPPNMTKQQREDQIKTALKRLEAAIEKGAVTLVVGANGGIAFKGWADRDGVTDACAYRRLLATNSFTMRKALMKAEAAAGRKVSAAVVNSGTHSHDGGQTWHAGHGHHH